MKSPIAAWWVMVMMQGNDDELALSGGGKQADSVLFQCVTTHENWMRYSALQSVTDRYEYEVGIPEVRRPKEIQIPNSESCGKLSMVCVV